MNLETLKTQFPARDQQIQDLNNLIGSPTDRSPPSIFIYGHTALAKSSIIKAYFTQYQQLPQLDQTPIYSLINCIECHSQRLIFEHIINTFANWIPQWSNGLTTWKRIDTLDVFVSTLQELLKNSKNEFTRYLIFDKSERLRDMTPTLVPVLLRLGELIHYSICVIFISSHPPSTFSPITFTPTPLLLHFPPYTKFQVIDILVHLTETSLILKKNDQEYDEYDEEDDLNFKKTFIEIIYDAFHTTCKDIRELRYAVRILWPKFIKPIEIGEVSRDDLQKLYKLSQKYFLVAMDKLYLREISLSNWSKDHDISNLGQTRDNLDLPYYSKFLLIASYLASYNPARLDMRFFAHGPENVRKKKGGATRKQVQKTSNKLSQQLLGPKPFPIERMLAIFYSILPDPIDATVEIQMQITSLITLRLLTRSSLSDQLDSPKVRCNVSYDFIHKLSKSVRFDITRWLYSTDL